MPDMPPSEVYEEELVYMPYRKSLKQVAEFICSNAPTEGSLLDLMCGPGFLLGQISSRRKDISLQGVDLDEGYISHASKKYPNIQFEVGDVLSWQPKCQFDVVICTGALHHIAYEKQAALIEIMHSMIKSSGSGIVSDCYIDDYSNELERKLAAAKLGYEYLMETMINGAPLDVISATARIIHDDVMMKEFKDSLKRRMPFFKRFFSDIRTFKTWPDANTQYGDYYTILKK